MVKVLLFWVWLSYIVWANSWFFMFSCSKWTVWNFFRGLLHHCHQGLAAHRFLFFNFDLELLLLEIRKFHFWMGEYQGTTSTVLVFRWSGAFPRRFCRPTRFLGSSFKRAKIWIYINYILLLIYHSFERLLCAALNFSPKLWTILWFNSINEFIYLRWSSRIYWRGVGSYLTTFIELFSIFTSEQVANKYRLL